MGSYIVSLPAKTINMKCPSDFRFGTEAMKYHLLKNSSGVIEKDWVQCVKFPRENGTGENIFRDPVTDSWIICNGTWFMNQYEKIHEPSLLMNKYFEIGPLKLASELEGFFLIIICDETTHELVIITDIVGSFHGYYRNTGNGILFSNSSAVLAAFGKTNIDSIGFQEFINLGIIYEDRTFYKEVKKLAPASIYVYSNEKLIKKDRYWCLSKIELDSIKGDVAVDSYWENVNRAVRNIQYVSNKPVSDLTAGLDSRILFASLLSSGMNFHTTVSGSEKNPDVVISKKIASEFGVPYIHIEYPMDIDLDDVKNNLSYTDGECDLFEYEKVKYVHKILSGKFDFSINGSFGELGKGIWWDLLFPHIGKCEPIDAQKLARRRYSNDIIDSAIFRKDIRIDMLEHIAEVIKCTNEGLKNLPNTLQMENAYLFMRMQRWQGRIASSTNRIWPCYSPFISRFTLETSLRICNSTRKYNKLLRLALEKHNKKLADIYLDRGYPAITAKWHNFYKLYPICINQGKELIKNLYESIPGCIYMKEKRFNDINKSETVGKCEALRDFMNPRNMLTLSMYDENAFSVARNNHCVENDFSYDKFYSRMFTVEHSLREIMNIKKVAANSVK